MTPWWSYVRITQASSFHDHWPQTPATKHNRNVKITVWQWNPYRPLHVTPHSKSVLTDSKKCPHWGQRRQIMPMAKSFSLYVLTGAWPQLPYSVSHYARGLLESTHYKIMYNKQNNQLKYYCTMENTKHTTQSLLQSYPSTLPKPSWLLKGAL